MSDKDKPRCGNCKYYGNVPVPDDMTNADGCYYFNFHPMPNSVNGSQMVVEKDDESLCVTWVAADK